MFKKALPFFMLAETSIHVGSGTDLGPVDLPIQREKHTNYPKIEASGIKGCIREDFEQLKDGKLIFKSETISKGGKYIEYIFGPKNRGDNAGAIGFTDGRILLFPVKSIKGVYGWATCPFVLERLTRDIHLCEILDEQKFNLSVKGIIKKLSENEVLVTDQSRLLIKGQTQDKVILEEYAYNATKSKEVTDLAETLSQKVIPEGIEFDSYRNTLMENLIILPNDDFKDFVTLSTEVVARTRINPDTGTVQTGALWYEENVPPDTVFYSIVMASPIMVQKANKSHEVLLFDENLEEEAQNVIDFFTDNLSQVLQIGGNATIGKGFVYTNIMRGERN